MAEGVAHAGGAGAVEHVRGGLYLFGARLDRALQQGLVVIQEDMEPGSATAKDPRLGVQPVVGVTDHDHGAAGRKACRILPLG